MKAVAMILRLPQVKANVWFVMGYLCIIVFLVFSIVNVKFECIKAGYAINMLTSNIQSLSIVTQDWQIQRDKYANKSALYQKGKAIGMEFPEASKVYYVE